MGKIRNLLWPYVVWTVITLCAAGEFSKLVSFWLWVGGAFHMWFLAAVGPAGIRR